jgi:hypothetical protein
MLLPVQPRYTTVLNLTDAVTSSGVVYEDGAA